MRLVYTICFFLLLLSPSYGQVLANCVEVVGQDSLKFYFNSGGILVDKECADYYRLAKMNPAYYIFNGPSKDFYASGQLAVECFYSNNLYDREYTSYYSNGQLKERGQYKEGQKVGEWEYWYEDGQNEKRILFKPDGYYLKEFYKSNGKQLVVNGNGKFIGTDIVQHSIVKGPIKDGQQHGKWVIINKPTRVKTGVERFEEGTFIEGKSIAKIQPFEEKYFDFPLTSIDLTEDLLTGSYSNKVDCFKVGSSNSYQFKKYNGKYTALPFYDYLYQNFDPEKPLQGYILVGFTVDKTGVLTNTKIYSTLNDKLFEEKLLNVFQLSEKWEPKKHNGAPIESTEFFVFQFLNDTYRILNDSRNNYPSVEYGAAFNYGPDSLNSYILQSLEVPSHFFQKGFKAATSVSFQIDVKGNLIVDDSVFEGLIRVEKNDRLLYEAVAESLKKTTQQWKPATTNGTLTRHHFNGVFTIRDGEPKFRLFSNNWVVY